MFAPGRCKTQQLCCATWSHAQLSNTFELRIRKPNCLSNALREKAPRDQMQCLTKCKLQSSFFKAFNNNLTRVCDARRAAKLAIASQAFGCQHANHFCLRKQTMQMRSAARRTQVATTSADIAHQAFGEQPLKAPSAHKSVLRSRRFAAHANLQQHI